MERTRSTRNLKGVCKVSLRYIYIYIYISLYQQFQRVPIGVPIIHSTLRTFVFARATHTDEEALPGWAMLVMLLIRSLGDLFSQLGS